MLVRVIHGAGRREARSLAHASGEALRQALHLIQNAYFGNGPYPEDVALLEAVEAQLRSGTAPAEHTMVRAHVLTSLGLFALRQGRLAAAQDYFTASHALFGQLGEPPQIGDATDPELGLGMLAMVAGDYQAAGRYAERVRVRNEASGQPRNQTYAWYLDGEGMAAALLGLGEVATRRGEHERAVEQYRASLAQYAKTGDRAGRPARAWGWAGHLQPAATSARPGTRSRPRWPRCGRWTSRTSCLTRWCRPLRCWWRTVAWLRRPGL